MYTVPLFNDIIIHKNRSLSEEERTEIVDKIYDLEKHLSSSGYGIAGGYLPETLHDLNDETLLYVIDYQQMLFAACFFIEHGKRPNKHTKL